MNGLSKWKVALYLAAIFVAGSVSGWVVATKTAKQKAYTVPRPDEIAQSLREHMCSKLNLSDDQKQKVDDIIEQSSAEIQSIHKEGIGRIRLALSNRNAQFSAVLSPEQQQQFEQIEKERHESMRGTNSWRSRRWREHNDGPHERRERQRATNNSALTNSTAVTNNPAAGH